ncbi:MAG: Gfo/Idh/MocA family oxidoreductase, partial [Armatimonadia bacterium]
MSIKVGLAGAGAVARAHLRAFVRHQQVEAVQVADPCAEARDRLAAEYGILRRSCADLAELLADESLELIDLCTPPELHCEQALAALRAAKHVIVETPLALTVQDCDEMIQVAAETGRHLYCALNHRWFPAHRRAEEALAAGEIGRPLLGMVAVLGDQRPLAADLPNWRDSWQQAAGTTLLESGYHAVYLLQRFFGPTSAVTVTTGKLSQPDSEAEVAADDTCLVALEMQSGALCNVVVTYAAAGDRWSEERRLIGSEGSLLIRDNPEDEMP